MPVSAAEKSVSSTSNAALDVRYAVYEPSGFSSTGNVEEYWYDYYDKKSTYWLDSYYFSYGDDGPSGVYECCDYNGNSLYKFTAYYDGPCFIRFLDDPGIDISVIHTGSANMFEQYHVEVFDRSGKKIVNSYIDTDSIPGYPDIERNSCDCYSWTIQCNAIFGDYLELTYYDSSSDNMGLWGYLNLKDVTFTAGKKKKLPEQIYSSKAYIVSDYNTSRWKTCEKSGLDDINLVSDGSKWCYINSENVILAQYADATNFTKSGYALVSNDRETYYLLDSDLHILNEYSFSGISACLAMYGTDTFWLTREDGSRSCIRINPEVLPTEDTIPSAPVIKKITTSKGNPKVTWKAVDGVIYYRLYRKTSTDQKYKKVADIKDPSKLSYTDKKWNAEPGTTISYKVRAWVNTSNGETWTGYSKAYTWKVTKDVNISLTEEKSPKEITEGSSFGIKGTISVDDGVLTKVTGKVTSEDGKKTYLSKSVKPNKAKYSLAGNKIDNAMKFGDLKPGTYVYTITVETTYTDAKVVIEQKFVVKAKPVVKTPTPTPVPPTPTPVPPTPTPTPGPGDNVDMFTEDEYWFMSDLHAEFEIGVGEMYRASADVCIEIETYAIDQLGCSIDFATISGNNLFCEQLLSPNGFYVTIYPERRGVLVGVYDEKTVISRETYRSIEKVKAKIKEVVNW